MIFSDFKKDGHLDVKIAYRYNTGKRNSPTIRNSLVRCVFPQSIELYREAIMAFDMQNCAYDPETGPPLNREYLERGLPPYLQTSIKRMCDSWFIEDSGQKDYHWDIAWCELNADINAAETEQEISSEQAWYLREKYLRMKRNDEM